MQMDVAVAYTTAAHLKYHFAALGAWDVAHNLGQGASKLLDLVTDH